MKKSKIYNESVVNGVYSTNAPKKLQKTKIEYTKIKIKLYNGRKLKHTAIGPALGGKQVRKWIDVGLRLNTALQICAGIEYSYGGKVRK